MKSVRNAETGKKMGSLILTEPGICKGVDEPYRMFTSRAEYRMLLRQDNADERLTEKSYNIGLARREQLDRYLEKRSQIDNLVAHLSTTNIRAEQANKFLVERGSSPITESVKFSQILSRPDINLNDMLDNLAELESFKQTSREVREGAEFTIKYAGYIEREKNNADKLKKLENLRIPDGFDYSKLQSITTEARSKLALHNPATIGQAARIPGVSPNDINVLLVYFGR